MTFERGEIEQLLGMDNCFQRITLMESGKLTIDIEKDDEQKRSMVIHFPTPEEAGKWVEGFFSTFANTAGSETAQ